MIDVDNQPNLDEVLASLCTTKDVIEKTNTYISDSSVADDDVYTFLIKQLKDTISTNSEVIEQTKDLILQLGTSEHISAHAALVKTQADLMKNMMSIIIDKKKLAQAKELKTRDLDLKELAITSKQSTDTGAVGARQTNILIASRDSIFDSLFGTEDEKKKAANKIREINGMTIDV